MMVALVVAAPLVAAVLGLGLRRAQGPLVTAGCLVSLGLLLGLHGEAAQTSVPFIPHAELDLSIGLEVSPLGVTIAGIVAAVSSLVMAYSWGYQREARSAFFGFMGLFVSAMLMLVLARSLLTLFIAWELVGLASFALIGFHHRDEEAKRAARSAFLVTRVADLALFVAVGMTLLRHGTTDFATLMVDERRPLVAVLLLVAAAGKAAQLPLSAWLPRAMVGPTPVSALLHSATMVAAGVFLVARLFPVIESARMAMTLLAWVGGATALVAALRAAAEGHLKRVLAWSTASQLAEMMLTLGLDDRSGAVVHLGSHAFFKAGLFVAAGIFARRAGESDIAALEGIGRRDPLAGAAFTACAFALTAIFPASGFFTGRLLLASALEHHAAAAVFVCLLAAATALYAGRLVAAIWAPARIEAEASVPFIMPAVALVFAAVSLGLPFVQPLLAESLAMAKHEPPGLGPQLVLAASSLVGLALARRVDGLAWVMSPVARALDGVLKAPATAALGLARSTRSIESSFSAGGLVLARGVSALAHRLPEEALARGARRLPRGVLSLASRLPEEALARAARAIAAVTLSAGGGVAAAERELFEEGADRGGEALLRLGQRLRRLEVGKIHFYVASLFGSAAALAIAAALAAWLGDTP